MMFALSGCGATSGTTASATTDAIAFAREGAEGETWFVQSLGGNTTPRPIALTGRLGNLQTAPAAGVWAANRATGTGTVGTLAVVIAGKARNVSDEWAWDFALRPDGGAIVYAAGRERRMFVAAAPEWRPALVEGLRDAVVSHPAWQGSRVVCITRATGALETVVASREGGGLAVLYRAQPGRTLSNLVAVPGSNDVLVVDAPENAPGRLVRVEAGTGRVTVLGEGFFAERGVVVSPDGRSIAAVWGAEAQAVQRGTATLRWFSAPSPGVPRALPGVTAAVWHADGAQLAVARRRDGRSAIEVYSTQGDPARPRVLGIADASSVAPAWWRADREFFQP